MTETPQKEPHHSAAAAIPHCLFCGAIGAWWDCHCFWGQQIRDGKLPRPKTVMRDGIPVIECCDELRAAARQAGVIRVTDAPANKATPAVSSETPAPRLETLTVRFETRAVETPRSETRGCPQCGSTFHATRVTQQFCSAACRLKAHRARDE